MLKGGFVIFDDFEANQWTNFDAQFRVAMPDAEFFPLDLSHPDERRVQDRRELHHLRDDALK